MHFEIVRQSLAIIEEIPRANRGTKQCLKY